MVFLDKPRSYITFDLIFYAPNVANLRFLMIVPLIALQFRQLHYSTKKVQVRGISRGAFSSAYQKALCNASMFKAFHFNRYKSFSMCSAQTSVFGNAYENLPLRLNRFPHVCFNILYIGGHYGLVVITVDYGARRPRFKSRRGLRLLFAGK